MKLIQLILISATLSACNKDDNPAIAEAQSRESRQPTSLDATAVRASEDYNDHRSKQMKDLLNSSAPPWLTLGPAIRPGKRDSSPDPVEIHSKGIVPKGASKVFDVEGKTIRLPVSASELTWLAFCPSGNHVILERGDSAEVRNVELDGTVSHSGDPLPALNFESDRRWMLTRWLWISESELVTSMNRPTTDGDIIAESKLYYFNLKAKNLREIDLPDKFMDPNDPYLEVIGSADRMVHIRTVTGNTWLSIPVTP